MKFVKVEEDLPIQSAENADNSTSMPISPQIIEPTQPHKSTKFVKIDESVGKSINSAIDLVPNNDAEPSFFDRVKVFGSEIGLGAKEIALGGTRGGVGMMRNLGQAEGYLGRFLRVNEDNIKMLSAVGVVSPIQAQLARSISSHLVDFGDKFSQHWERERTFLEGFKDKDTWKGTFEENPNIIRILSSVAESIPLMATGVAAGAAAGATWVGASILGTAQGLGTYQEALDKGKSDTRALTVGAIDAGLSTASELVLDSFGLSALGKIIRNKFTKNIASEIITTSAKEGFQEAAQQMTTNLVRKYGIDKSVEVLEGTCEAAVIGALTGGAMTGLASSTRAKEVVQSLPKEEAEAIVEIQGQLMKENADYINGALKQQLNDIDAQEQLIQPMKPEEFGNEQIKDVTGTEEDLLIAEARKYKSAEEFASAQGETVYHLTDKDFKNIEIGKEKKTGTIYDAFFAFKDRKSLDSEVYKNRFGNIKKEVVVSGKIADLNNATTKELKELTSMVGNPQKENNLNTKLQELGYSGFEFGGEVVIFDKNKVKTREELNDIWNKSQETQKLGDTIAQAEPAQEPVKNDRMKVSRQAERRAETIAKEYGIEFTDDDLSKYETVTDKEELSSALVEWDKDPAMGLEYALGQTKAPKGIVPSAFYVIAEKVAKRDRNVELLKQLASQNMMVEESSRAGQFIQQFSQIEPDSPLNTIKTMESEKVKEYNKINKDDARKVIKKQAKELNKKITDKFAELDSEIEDFIKSIERC